MTSSISNLINQAFNDIYPVRPVWALASNGLTANNSPVYATYGAANPYVPLNVEFPGNSKTKARAFEDAMAAASYLFMGNATAPTTNLWTPSEGYYGITVNTQTGCLNNFDAADNGNYGYYQSVNSASDQLAAVSGIVVGEANWRQCYELILTNGGLIYKEPIGGGLNTAISGNRPFINMNNITGFTSAGTANWGYGQISHNRNTGHLLIAQPNGGVLGSYITFRLHILNLQNKISANTTIAQLNSWITAACAAGSGLYAYHDVEFASARCYYSATVTDSFDQLDSEFVLCNDDSVWMFKSADTATTGAAYSNQLFAAYFTSGTFITGTYTSTAPVGFTNNTQYGHATAPMYGARHMNSDDNTVIALYQHSYYYIGGYNIAMVSTASAYGGSGFNYATASAPTGYTIAPTGLANFVLCVSGVTNVGAGGTLAFLDNQVLSETAITPTASTCLWPTYMSASTCYGGNMVLKVQPTTEWQ
jgi:hypothetical protein